GLVGEDAHVAHHLALLAADRGGGGVHQAHVAPRAQEAEPDIEPVAAAARPPPGAGHSLSIVRVDRLQPAAAAGVLVAQPGLIAQARVDVLALAGGVGANDPVCRQLREGAELGDPQGELPGKIPAPLVLLARADLRLAWSP